MGTEYRARIVVGLPFEELETVLHHTHPELEFDAHDHIHSLVDDDLVFATSPYFDAPVEDSVIGFMAEQSDDYSAHEIELVDVAVKIGSAKVKWEEVFPGIEPKVYLTPYGW